MRAPMSWLTAWADLDAVPAAEVAAALVRVGLEVERVEPVGHDLAGVVVGEVCAIEELTGLRKPIRYCEVTVGGPPRGIICGATNFAVGDRVAVALPGAALPGVPFQITAKKTYGRLSNGMICSPAELGIGDDAGGILVLDSDAAPGADLAELLHLRDEVLDVAVTPDRGYCLSIRGLAREAATACGVAYRDPAAIDVPIPDGGAYDVQVEDTGGCSRYVARVVTGLDPVATSPLWLRRRLALTGLRPISLPVDVTNHVLMELGQPQHAFDRDRLTGPIVVRRARPGERLTTLDGADRALDRDDLVITDRRGPVALAGVMGGAGSEVTATTTAVVLESAHFESASVARAARRHRLSTEASRRYERGVDDALAPAAAAAAVRLLTELAGAQAAPGSTDVDHRLPRPVISLPVAFSGAVAGTPIPADAVCARLATVGCEVHGEDPLAVRPPSWRPDLLEPIDLVEEVVRLGGYDAIPATLPPAPPGRGLTVQQRLRRRIGRSLAEAGYVEVSTYPFVSSDIGAALGLEPDDERRSAVRLVNPVADTEPTLRTTLLPGLLAALARNVSRGTADVALFEEGPVFLRAASGQAPSVPGQGAPPPATLAALDAALPRQPRHLAGVLAGDREPAGWWGSGRRASWADAVEGARRAAHSAQVAVEVEAAQQAPWHPGRCARVLIAGTPAGYAGELHPRALDALHLPVGTCAFELDLDVLVAAAPDVVAAPGVSAYPLASIDVALVVADGVPAAEVEEALREGAGPLLEAIRLFDVYTGAQVGEGRRSLAYNLRLRAPDRTLTTTEVTGARDCAVAAAGAATGAVLRGG